MKIFRAGCDSPPAVKSANTYWCRNGEIPLPTVIVRMKEEKHIVFYTFTL